MHSALGLLALLPLLQSTFAGPVRRYSNDTIYATSSSPVWGTGASPNQADTASIIPLKVAHATTSAAQDVQPTSSAVAYAAAVSSQDASTNSSSSQSSWAFDYAPEGTSDATNSAQTSKDSTSSSPLGTITLTLFTTVAPSSQTTSTARHDGSSQITSGSSDTLPATVPTSGSDGQTTSQQFSNASFVFSDRTTTATSGSPTTHDTSTVILTTSGSTSSSPAIYGGVTLTYTVSTDTTRGPATLSRATGLMVTYDGSSISNPWTTSSEDRSTSAAAPYPLPAGTTQSDQSTITTSSFPDSTVTFNAAQTSETTSNSDNDVFPPTTTTLQPSSSNPSFAFDPMQASQPTTMQQHTGHPHGQQTGLPDVVSQQQSQDSAGPTWTTSSAPQGITIVPLDLSSLQNSMNAITVTVTTTETDAGVTTTATVAERTVTVGAS